MNYTTKDHNTEGNFFVSGGVSVENPNEGVMETAQTNLIQNENQGH